MIKDARQFPIRRIAFTTPAADRARYLDEGKLRYKTYLAAGDDGAVRAFVAERLAHEPEQSDVIHDLLAISLEEMIRLNKENGQSSTYLDGLVAALQVVSDREWAHGIGCAHWEE